jgi:hypothetical protein
MVDVAGGLCNGGIVRTEPRSESRPRRRSRAPLIAVVWDASFERRRRLGAPRVARSDPSLTSRLSRIGLMRRAFCTLARNQQCCAPVIPKAACWVLEAPRATNYFGKLGARFSGAVVVGSRGRIPARGPLHCSPRRTLPPGARRARRRMFHSGRVEGRAPSLLVVPSELEVVALAGHADRDVPDAGPGVEPGAQRVERAVVRRQRAPGEAERRQGRVGR